MRRFFALFAGLCCLHAQPSFGAQPAAFQIECKEAGTLTARAEGGKTILSIKGGSGIGRATVRRSVEPWPQEIVVRAYLGGLEHLAISNSDVTLSASVLSHSGNRRLLHLKRDGKEGPALEKGSPYWMEIQTLDAAGKPVNGLPPKGGWFEMAVPNALLTEARELGLEWIDFYR
jgi:ribosomal protein S27E